MVLNNFCFRFPRLGVPKVTLVAIMAAGALLVGCSDGRPRRVRVSGTVLIDGKPVTTGFIRVIPSNARAAVGQIDAQGRFVLTTFDPGDGCVPGTHRVEVVAYEKTPSGSTRLLVPEKYKDASTSDLSVTIDGPTDNLVVQLTWAGQTPVEIHAETQGDADPTKLQ